MEDRIKGVIGRYGAWRENYNDERMNKYACINGELWCISCTCFNTWMATNISGIGAIKTFRHGCWKHELYISGKKE